MLRIFQIPSFPISKSEILLYKLKKPNINNDFVVTDDSFLWTTYVNCTFIHISRFLTRRQSLQLEKNVFVLDTVKCYMK